MITFVTIYALQLSLVVGGYILVCSSLRYQNLPRHQRRWLVCAVMAGVLLPFEFLSTVYLWSL